MNGPPRHVQLFRVALVTLVVLTLVVATLLISWSEFFTAIDPAVDGLRRRMWS